MTEVSGLVKGRFVAMLFATALLSGCNSGKDGMADFATRYAEAWSGQDPAALAAFYAEDGILVVNDGAPSVGRAAIEATAGAFMTAFPDMVVELVELERRDDDSVVFHWHWTGTNTGPGGTGNPVDITGYEEWTLNSDGEIRESLGHYDDAEYQRQMSVTREH